jgi:hypothetical protein
MVTGATRFNPSAPASLVFRRFSKFVSFDNSSPYHHVSRQVLKEAARCAVTRDGFLAWYENALAVDLSGAGGKFLDTNQK